MVGSLMKYGGIATKVRAMYGRHLKRDDYQRMASMPGVPEIAAYLKRDPGWAHSLRNINEASVRRAELERALREGYWDDMVRVTSFVIRDDRKIMDLSLLRSDISIIMAFIRKLNSEDELPFNPGVTDRQAVRSGIDISMLYNGKTYSDLLAAAGESRFYEVLAKNAPIENEPANYTRIENALNAFLYNSLLKAYEKNSSRDFSRIMKSFLGMQIDLTNISRVIRVRKYFSNNFNDMYALLIPTFSRINVDFLQSLFSAQTDAATRSTLLSSPYRKVFENRQFNDIERYVSEAVYDFNRRHLRMSPSLINPMCYLQLKEIELQNIINTIECVRYGVEPERVFNYLVGVASGG